MGIWSTRSTRARDRLSTSPPRGVRSARAHPSFEVKDSLKYLFHRLVQPHFTPCGCEPALNSNFCISSREPFDSTCQSAANPHLPIANHMPNAFSSVARQRVSSSISRFILTRSSSFVTRPSRIAIEALLNAEIGPSIEPDQALITVNGFVRSIRKQKRVAFAAIGDGSTLESLQAVLSPEQANMYMSSAARMRGSAPADATFA